MRIIENELESCYFLLDAVLLGVVLESDDLDLVSDFVELSRFESGLPVFCL